MPEKTPRDEGEKPDAAIRALVEEAVALWNERKELRTNDAVLQQFVQCIPPESQGEAQRIADLLRSAFGAVREFAKSGVSLEKNRFENVFQDLHDALTSIKNLEKTTLEALYKMSLSEARKGSVLGTILGDMITFFTLYQKWLINENDQVQLPKVEEALQEVLALLQVVAAETGGSERVEIMAETFDLMSEILAGKRRLEVPNAVNANKRTSIRAGDLPSFFWKQLGLDLPADKSREEQTFEIIWNEMLHAAKQYAVLIPRIFKNEKAKENVSLFLQQRNELIAMMVRALGEFLNKLKHLPPEKITEVNEKGGLGLLTGDCFTLLASLEHVVRKEHREIEEERKNLIARRQKTFNEISKQIEVLAKQKRITAGKVHHDTEIKKSESVIWEIDQRLEVLNPQAEALRQNVRHMDYLKKITFDIMRLAFPKSGRVEALGEEIKGRVDRMIDE